MKTVIFSFLFMSSVGGFASGGFGSKDVICFKTLDGKKLEAYVYQEPAESEEIPGLLNSMVNNQSVSKHQDLARLLKEIRKPEQEEALPFDLN